MSDHFETNRANWDERAQLHAARTGTGYQVQRYIDDHRLLSEVVQFDLPLLGDIDGLRAVHLQCHIGTDTLSLARLGARMTGLDFSSEAIAQARRLVAETGDAVEFVQANVYDAVAALPAGGFDLVYTGIGALCWLPEIRPWAAVVSRLLAPGGFLFMREAHPVLDVLDDELQPAYRYFESGQPLVWNEASSYVTTARPLQATVSYTWNHGLGETISALIDAGLRIELLAEHDSVPWEAFPGRMAECGGGEWRLREHPGALPLSYTVRASKPAG